MPDPGPTAPEKPGTPSSVPTSSRQDVPRDDEEKEREEEASRTDTVAETPSATRPVQHSGSGVGTNSGSAAETEQPCQAKSTSGALASGGSRPEALLQSVGDAMIAMGDARARIARQGSILQDVAEELIRDIWQPLPRSLSKVMKTFKDIKQSVVEVIRVVGVEVHIPADLPEVQSVEVTIHQSVQRFCRRRRQVYGSFTLPLHHHGSLRSGFPNYDCRVLALHRRRGGLQLKVELLGASRRSGRWKGGPSQNVLARYTAAVPAMSSTPDMVVEMTEAEYLAHSMTAKQVNNCRSESISVGVTLRALQSKEVFDISRCKPSYMKYMGHNEWRPVTGRQWSGVWKSSWRDDNLVNWAGLLHTMTADMKNDAIILYQTLFAQSLKNSPPRPSLSKEEEEAHDLRVLFLKRLILCLAACKLTYCTEENGSFLRAWPFPLASALAHGNRILVRLDGVPWQAFVNLLLFGDPKHHQWSGEDAVPSPFWARWAATHAIGLQPDTSRLYERRLKTGSVVKNVKDGLLGHHLGMDLPLGGLGNRAPPNLRNGPLFVGPAGVPFRKLSNNMDENPEYAEEVQNGHLYLRWDDFGVTTIPLLAAETGTREPSKGRRSHRYGSWRSTTPVATPPASASQSEVPTAPVLSSEKDPSIAATDSLFSGPLPQIDNKPSVLTNEEWVQLPSLRSEEDLQAVLKEHGYVEIARNEDGCLQRLYRLLAEDSELALQSNGEGRLRLRGVLIHLVLEHDFEAEEKVLVHLAAEAAAERDNDEEGAEGEQDKTHRRSGIKVLTHELRELEHELEKDVKWGISKIGHAGHSMVERLSHHERFMHGSRRGSKSSVQASSSRRVEDARVAAELRRRHEPWTEAMRRLCQSQLQLGVDAVDKILKKCCRAMSGEAGANGEEELYVYRCEGPPSLCHHHNSIADSGIPVEYQAYRFTVALKKKQRAVFQSLVQADFATVEHGLNLDNFGGGLRGRTGSITRSWVWMSRAEAAERKVAGLNPPEERLHIIHETAPLSAVMIGIENSAPHKESFFTSKHGVSGVSKDVSAFGMRKWRDYRRGGQEVPADIGGMRMQIDQQAFQDLISLFKEAPLSRPSAGYLREAAFERRLFRALLVASDEEAESILRDHLKFGRPTLQSQTGTMVLDSNVKERSVSSKSIGSEIRRRDNSSKTIISSRPIDLDDSEDETEHAKAGSFEVESRQHGEHCHIDVEPGDTDGNTNLEAAGSATAGEDVADNVVYI